MPNRQPGAGNVVASLGTDNLNVPVIGRVLKAELPKLSPGIRDGVRDVLQRKEQDHALSRPK